MQPTISAVRRTKVSDMSWLNARIVITGVMAEIVFITAISMKKNAFAGDFNSNAECLIRHCNCPTRQRKR